MSRWVASSVASAPEHAFSTSHLNVLGRLEREGARTTSGLAVAERVRPQSMAQTIAELDGNSLVTRRPDPSDRRQTLIELSELAERRSTRARLPGRLASSTAIRDELSPREQELLARAVPLLTRIAES